METILTAATILAMYLNLSSNPGSDYAYNAQIEDGAVKTLQVYSSEAEMLTPKLQYSYSYDAEGKVVEKEAQKWNAARSVWEPYYRHAYTYSASGYAVRRTGWNQRTGRYDLPQGMVSYEVVNGSVTAVNTYTLGQRSLRLCLGRRYPGHESGGHAVHGRLHCQVTSPDELM